MTAWRLMVADQDPSVRERVRRLASDLGGYSVAVDSGTQALHVLSTGTWLAALCSPRLLPPNGMRLVGLARRAGITTPIILLARAADLQPSRFMMTTELALLCDDWLDEDLRGLLLPLLSPVKHRLPNGAPPNHRDPTM